MAKRKWSTYLLKCGDREVKSYNNKTYKTLGQNPARDKHRCRTFQLHSLNEWIKHLLRKSYRLLQFLLETIGRVPIRGLRWTELQPVPRGAADGREMWAGQSPRRLRSLRDASIRMAWQNHVKQIIAAATEFAHSTKLFCINFGHHGRAAVQHG